MKSAFKLFPWLVAGMVTGVMILVAAVWITRWVVASEAVWPDHDDRDKCPYLEADHASDE